MGNEIKNLAYAASQTVLNLELYKGKEPMSTMEFVKPFGATTATTIRLTQPYHGGGCRVIADSWFGSVKSARELMKHGLYYIMVVKTAHKNFSRQLLSAKKLERGEWVPYNTERDEVKLLACRKSTTFKCIQCNVPLCKPSKGHCWELHLNGLPKPKCKEK